jgi:hypothetical protein
MIKRCRFVPDRGFGRMGIAVSQLYRSHPDQRRNGNNYKHNYKHYNHNYKHYNRYYYQLPVVRKFDRSRLNQVEFNQLSLSLAHHFPTFCIDAQGSCFGSGLPFCNSSMEMLSGERMKAM